MDGASLEKNSRNIAAGIWCVLIPALVKIKFLVKRSGAQRTSLNCSLKQHTSFKKGVRVLGAGYQVLRKGLWDFAKAFIENYNRGIAAGPKL